MCSERRETMLIPLHILEEQYVLGNHVALLLLFPISCGNHGDIRKTTRFQYFVFQRLHYFNLFILLVCNYKIIEFFGIPVFICSDTVSLTF